MNSFQTKLYKYVSLAIEIGINVQPGQTVVIFAPVGAAEFVRGAVRRAYEVGAKHVYVEWSDDEVTRARFELASGEALEEYPMWRAKGYEELAENNAAFLYVVSENPDLLKGIDASRIQTSSKAANTALRGLTSLRLKDKVSWAIVGVPSAAWANRVFPALPEEERVSALWEAIFDATRVNHDNPVQAWREHTNDLGSRAQKLNDKQYAALHYLSEGTDITVELPQDHIWVSAGGTDEKSVTFMKNIPTEEVFTSPLRTGVNGTVRSTKPLSYGGNVLENFTLTFKDGKIVEYAAEKGYDILKSLIEIDEGSHYLGEIALVPYQSPISNTNLIFYNTLFDENASCHFAIGRAFPFCLQGGTEMSQEELRNRGLNDSLTHVDFMMGSSEMNIDGILENGEREPIFRNGNWAF